ncbi:hypothetical protein RM407_000226 [Enterobacter kobei]|nr:hypothetical protein [Enterobacter kobei]
MDESRKLYEEWFHSRYDSISMPPKDRVNLFTFSWAAWQASRAAIEIDLPEWFSPHDCGDKAMWSDAVEKAIRAAGIKVKE